MAKKQTRVYTEDEKAVALAFYATLRDLDKAARRSKVDAKSLALWVAGGDEKESIANTESLLRSRGSLRETIQEDPDEDYETAVYRKEYEERRLSLFLADGRPYPPFHMADPIRTPVLVQEDLDLAEWVNKTFIGGDDYVEGPLWNPDHAHLATDECTIGFKWINVENRRQGKFVGGTTELVSRLGDKWQTAEYHYDLMKRFGQVPTFLIRLDSVWCAQASDAQFAALIEHELYHCGLKMDEFGQPKVDRFGNFEFAIRGHDCEEFVGVVRRYGAKASAAGTVELVKAGSVAPSIAEAELSEVFCGCGASL